MKPGIALRACRCDVGFGLVLAFARILWLMNGQKLPSVWFVISRRFLSDGTECGRMTEVCETDGV